MAYSASIGRAMRVAGSTLALMASGHALAAPGNAQTVTGSANASVVEPIGIQNVADLRFGRIMQPSAAGTVSISTAGAVTETGGVVGQTNTPQLAGNRGPGAFAIFGDPNRFFAIFPVASTTISNGTASMTVDQFNFSTTNTFFIFGILDATGYAPLISGGRLNVGANQQTGTYSGTYDVTVLYL